MEEMKLANNVLELGRKSVSTQMLYDPKGKAIGLGATDGSGRVFTLTGNPSMNTYDGKIVGRISKNHRARLIAAVDAGLRKDNL